MEKYGFDTIGPNPFLDPLHRIAYASLTAIAGARMLSIIALDSSLNVVQIKGLLLDLLKDTVFEYFLITLHYYAAERALEQRNIQTGYDATKLKETQAIYSLDQGVNITIALGCSLNFLGSLYFPLYSFYHANKTNQIIPFYKKVDLVGDLLSNLTVFSTLSASDYYIINEARKLVLAPPSLPPKPS